MNGLNEEIEALERLDLGGLREVWPRRFGRPPRIMSWDLLRHLLAWRLQAERFGGLGAEAKAALRRTGAIVPAGRELGVGAILERSWKGRAVRVEVLDRGFRFDGKVYPSLSVIAREVTGTHWSGPRFFGLRP